MEGTGYRPWSVRPCYPGAVPPVLPTQLPVAESPFCSLTLCWAAALRLTSSLPGLGLEELHTPPMLAALPGPCTTDTTPRDPGRPQGGSSGSSTSSGEDYCNSPKSRPPPWSPQAFSLELAGPPMPLPGGGESGVPLPW